jgi:uncharacterized membrane protein YhaH (DUF805 family)
MELYFVIARLITGTRNKFEDYRILRFDANTPIDQQIPAGFERKRGPASLDDCVEYLKDVSDDSGRFISLTYLQYGLIFVVTMAFVLVILFGAYNAIYSQDDNARNLITFLVAVGTIAIAFLAILTAMVIREFKERFAMAKEVLTILVGVLGTIVGFYFGTAATPKENANKNTNANANANTHVNGNTNAAPRSNGNSNTDNNTNTNVNVNANNKGPSKPANIGANSRTHVLHLPDGKNVVVAYTEKGVWELLCRT